VSIVYTCNIYFVMHWYAYFIRESLVMFSYNTEDIKIYKKAMELRKMVYF